MMQFNGKERNEWPVFAEGLIAMGARKGGWDEALEYKLDLEVAANKRLNKLAWCYLTLMLEGDALQEMDMIPNKNAYVVWQHLNEQYAPRVGKRMKFTTHKWEVETAIEFDGAWEDEKEEQQHDEPFSRVYKDHPIKEEEKFVEDSDKFQVDSKVDYEEDNEDHPIKEEECLVEKNEQFPVDLEDCEQDIQEDCEAETRHLNGNEIENEVQENEKCETWEETGDAKPDEELPMKPMENDEATFNDSKDVEEDHKHKTREEESGTQDVKKEEKCLSGEEESKMKVVKEDEKCSVGRKESQIADTWNDKECSIGEEEVQNKVEEKDNFANCYYGEEAKKKNKEKELVQKELEKQFVSKVEREAVNRFKEKVAE